MTLTCAFCGGSNNLKSYDRVPKNFIQNNTFCEPEGTEIGCFMKYYHFMRAVKFGVPSALRERQNSGINHSTISLQDQLSSDTEKVVGNSSNNHFSLVKTSPIIE